MATLQHLSGRQIDDVIRAASERRVPVTITVRSGQSWASLRGRMIDVREGHVWLELPESDHRARRFEPADKAGVSFKLKHHKHIFTGTVARLDEAGGEQGEPVPVLRVCSPTRMHRMQRRAFQRVDVPANRVVRASFWLGGRDAEPAGPSPQQPVWSGRVTNVSAGGFQVATADAGPEVLRVGEAIGVRLSFGVGDRPVYADAQFRHAQTEDDGTSYIGFQFIGLAQTAEGRHAMQVIGSKAAQFQREAAGGRTPLAKGA